MKTGTILRRLAVTTVVVVGVLTGASMQAVAAPSADPTAIYNRVSKAADPQKEYSKLNATQKKAFALAVTPATVEFQVEPASEVTPMGICKGWYSRATRKAANGNELYAYWQTTGYCYENGVVTDVWVDNPGQEILSWPWNVTGAPTTGALNVGWEGRGVSQHFFKASAWEFEVFYDSPCIQHLLNANGVDRRRTTSCDLWSP